MRICDCRKKEVINISDCRRVGYLSDVVIDGRNGCIEAIIVPGPSTICGFLGHDKEYVIPWECIVQFGEDIILINVKLKEVETPCRF